MYIKQGSYILKNPTPFVTNKTPAPMTKYSPSIQSKPLIHPSIITTSLESPPTEETRSAPPVFSNFTTVEAPSLRSALLPAEAPRP